MYALGFAAYKFVEIQIQPRTELNNDVNFDNFRSNVKIIA